MDYKELSTVKDVSRCLSRTVSELVRTHKPSVSRLDSLVPSKRLEGGNLPRRCVPQTSLCRKMSERQTREGDTSRSVSVRVMLKGYSVDV